MVDYSINGFIDLGDEYIKNNPQEFEIFLKKLNDIIKILPGMNSPTVLPLAKKGWSSVHSVIDKNQFWEIIDALKQNGAEGILICSIEKMVI